MMSTKGRTRLTRSFGARAVGLAVFTLLLAGIGLAASAMQEQPFPHEKHEGLFPLCTGCHQGIPENEPATYYPIVGICTSCHNGEFVEEITWSPPAQRITNLRFEHSRHAELLQEEGDPDQTCETCHTAPGAERMSVQTEIGLETCLSCHEHQAPDHQTSANCVVCHIPLAESGFGLPAIEAIEEPADHGGERFILEDHGEAAEASVGRCATCHTQERCVSCHVDTGQDEIDAMARAPEGMALPHAEARYPEPDDHQADRWFEMHGKQASATDCATCHTSNDCTTCHVAPMPNVIATLPAREQVVAPGVGVEGHAPNSHESLFFTAAHPTLAASDGVSCATCHQESFCVECHDGPSAGGYHPAGFVSRHSADAFGRDNECATCHSTEVFCRGCHTEVGLTGFGSVGAEYHADETIWLLRHGQAARQSLETCVSCHQQNDCTKCHGTLGALSVSPHSRDFDAERAWAKSPETCAACHIGNPLIGNLP